MQMTLTDLNSDANSSTQPPSPGSSADEADVDWNFARREATLAKLGMDPTLENLPDEELNKLFDKITRAKTLRNHNAKARPGSSLSHVEDVWSESGRPFGGETVTDDTSIDHIGTQPSPDLQESLRDIQGHLEAQQHDLESRSSELSDSRTEDLKLEKEYVESQLRAVTNQMKRLIDLHSRGLSTTPVDETEPVLYTARQLRLIRRVLDKWRSHRSFAMSEAVLGRAVFLKEANIVRQATL
jgi:kinesin family member 1